MATCYEADRFVCKSLSVLTDPMPKLCAVTGKRVDGIGWRIVVAKLYGKRRLTVDSFPE